MTAAIDGVWMGEARPYWLSRQFAMQTNTGFVWSPVFMICGIWCYFLLPIEPAWPVFAAILPLAGLLFALARQARGGFTVFAGFIFLTGFLLAKLQVLLIVAPLLPASTPPVEIRGEVESLAWKGSKLADVRLRVERLDDVNAAFRPLRLKMTLRSPPDELAPGDLISGKAILRPLPVPVYPGGFDYGRQLFLDGFGGTGRFVTALGIDDVNTSWRYWPARGVNVLRNEIGRRISAVLPGGRGAFAEALITGVRGGIPKPVTESLQVSGLSHILSISGLHMSLVAGGVFWLVRALLALSSTLALHYPIKKWAAAAALAVGFVYMMLAGADVATQRSYIMLAIIFVAIMVDRAAFSLRNLALAALIILVTQPSAALSASFHMSFMAVMGLAAFYQAYGEWRLARAERVQAGTARRLFNRTGLALFSMAAATLVAGALSSIPAAFHFGRLAPLSILTNLLALPVISVIVMPFAMISVLLMPLGLERLPLWIMGQGLDLVVVISDWVASFDVSHLHVPLVSGGGVVLMAFGMIWLCLWKGALRLVGLAIFMTGVIVSPFRDHPDILVEPTAANVAVRDNLDRLFPADPKRARFAIEKWRQAEGYGPDRFQSPPPSGWKCVRSACRVVISGMTVSYVREEEDIAEACAGSDILVAAFPLRGGCRSAKFRIDRFDVWRNGAYALKIDGDSITILTSREEQGQRPWVVKPVARKYLAAGPVSVSSTHSRDVVIHAGERDEPENPSVVDDPGPRSD